MRTIYIRTLAKRTLATVLLKFNQLGALSSAFVS